MRKLFIILVLVLITLAVYYWSNSYGPDKKGMDKEQSVTLIEDSLDTSGMNLLVDAEGVITVRSYCTGCHSEKLVAQNRATREGWETMIRWMQRTQNLGDLGENESKILDYLAENYAPENKGRREQLVVDWYSLSD